MNTSECLHATEKSEARRIIREKTDYFINSTTVLNQIFRRSSFAAEIGRSSNEIFEFIGDQVLSFYVIKSVSKKCGSLSLTSDYTFRIRENQFTQIKQALVNNESLAKIIDEWDIIKFLRMSRSDIKNEAFKETKVKADLFEAIIGAIAIECDWNPLILENAISKALDIDSKIKAMIESDRKTRLFDMDNAVTVLKETAEKGQCTMPKYHFCGPDDIGYDSDGKPKWICTCSIINENTGITRQVDANSKKDAKKAAAYLVLCEHFEAQNKYGDNDWVAFWIYKDGKLFPNRPSDSKGE